MLGKRTNVWASTAIMAVAAVLFSGCGGGGGGGTPPHGGMLTGSSAVSSSAVSRVGRGSVANVRTIQQTARPRQGNHGILSRSRQAMTFDEDYGLYSRLRMNSGGARIELFEDSAGQRPAGNILYRETPSSYEIIVDIEKGIQPQKAYFKLAETGSPDRIRLIARYEDRKTGEKSSVEGDLVVRGASRSRQDDEDDPYDWEDEWNWGDWGGNEDDWYDDYDWWDETGDEYFGDDYFGEEDEFFGNEEYFEWEGESETAVYDDIGDFEIVRFEGEIAYEGCSKEVKILNARLDFLTGRLTGTIQFDDSSGSVDYDYTTEQGQIVLNAAEGQIRITFRGEEIVATYPDGRTERVNRSQWRDPCEGVEDDNNQDGDDNQGGNFSLSSSAFANNGAIPLKYASTAIGGQNVSPPLSWSDAPSGTRSFVLVCLDPDADNFVHWVMYDIPASVTSLPEGVPSQSNLPNGAKQGENNAGTIGYFGPEPPEGEHRYVLTLYALAVDTLGLDPGVSYARVKEVLDNLRSQNKVLGEAQIVGKFRAN